MFLNLFNNVEFPVLILVMMNMKLTSIKSLMFLPCRTWIPELESADIETFQQSVMNVPKMTVDINTCRIQQICVDSSLNLI